MAHTAFHTICQYARRLLGRARKESDEAAAGRRWGRTTLFLLLMPVCALAQNNPYKISDSLYPLYREAYAKRHSPQGVALADRLYSESDRQGDKKAKCLALTIPVYYYADLMGSDNEAAFVRAVEKLQKDALASGYRQYYYFGLTNRVNYLLNRMRNNEALDMAQKFEEDARRRNDKYGIYYGLNNIAQAHTQRHETTLAIKALKEALEVGTKYIHDQDMATIYRKLAQCYDQLFYYQESYDTAKRGYSVARTNSARSALIYQMAFAQLKMQNYDRVGELYSQFERVNGKPDTAHLSMYERCMLVMKYIVDRDEYHAVEQLDGMPKIYTDRHARLMMEVHRRKNNMPAFSRFRQFFYESYITRQDSMHTGALVDLVSRTYNSRLELDNRALTIERQRAESERRQTELYNTSLELSNTELSLRNSSLELGRAHADADRLRLANANKRLEAERLKSRIDEEHARHKAKHLRVACVSVGFAVLLIAALLTMRVYRRVNRRLYGIHRNLVATHAQLKEAHKRAVAADNAKTALLNNMTADINMPLNSIAGFAQLITDSPDAQTPEERREYFRQISDNTQRMLAIVSDVLEKVQKT